MRCVLEKEAPYNDKHIQDLLTTTVAAQCKGTKRKSTQVRQYLEVFL